MLTLYIFLGFWLTACAAAAALVLPRVTSCSPATTTAPLMRREWQSKGNDKPAGVATSEFDASLVERKNLTGDSQAETIAGGGLVQPAAALAQLR